MEPDAWATALPGRQEALQALVASAATNVSGVDFASITLLDKDQRLSTLAATDPVAEELDALQYELREGPCYAAVTDERLVLINDMATSTQFPRFGPRAVELGVGAHAAIQLIHDGERAGLNLYAREPDVFDQSTVHVAELFAGQTAAILEYAEQVEQLSEALHTRTDIGIAIGIVMERYDVDSKRAFAFLSRTSQARNIKLRLLAQQLIQGSFESTPDEDDHSKNWPR